MLDAVTKKKSGSYYTKPEIVSLILDLVGYTTDKPLYNHTLLEPSTGEGAFLHQIVSRLIDSVILKIGPSLFTNEDEMYELLKEAITSIEIDSTKHSELLSTVKANLCDRGLSESLSQRLIDKWIIKNNFLLWNKPVIERYNYIVGNPPYIRIENLDDALEKFYREQYSTLYDRADIYVAFIEHSLEMLHAGGRLGFICTDRFTKNRYGKEIRTMINQNYRVVHFLDIHNAQAFEDEVSAYPCIFTIENSTRGVSKTLKMDKVTCAHLTAARDYLILDKTVSRSDIEVHTITDWFKGSAPWVLNGEQAHLILQKLESENKLITEEPHSIHVGIGVATGANDLYVIHPDVVDVEREVLLPTVTKEDIKSGVIRWRGYYVINPYKEDGSLINLEDYPKLRSYFYRHEERVKSRSTAKNNPNKWYKTIDRIFPERLQEAKLLIPDIKSKNLIVKDEGNYYPEHSLYYITSGTWDIDALQSLLTSSVIKFFIWSYATKMRGDYLRYQAQYLRKIRLPVDIKDQDISELKRLYLEEDYEGIDLVAKKLYNLSDLELKEIKDLVQ